ncbi:hypothetical protein ACYJ1Y_18300 [Natrialbaceae archaeon A-gly3]
MIVANSGPVDYLGWLFFEGYHDHCFFYKDKEPDQQTLRWFLSISPQESDVPQFKRFLQKSYDEYGEGTSGVAIEIPDTYLPGSARTFQSEVREEVERHTFDGKQFVNFPRESTLDIPEPKQNSGKNRSLELMI